jgi:hypothetical protein
VIARRPSKEILLSMLKKGFILSNPVIITDNKNTQHIWERPWDGARKNGKEKRLSMSS